MSGLNIHKLVSTSLQGVTAMHKITIKAFVGQTKDANCDWIVSYQDITATARIQLENVQKLLHIEKLNMTAIHKRFYISANALTGLNRNINSGGDYIQFGSLFYKIIEVKYNFETGWFAVIGAESDRLGG